MNAMRTLLDGRIPLVAVSFLDKGSQRLADEARTVGVDIAELRVDRFARTDVPHVLEQVRLFRSLPVLATVRSAREGGEWSGSEEERLALFRALAPRVDGVDIELSSREILPDVIAAARQHDTVVVVSHHNFDATPSVEELESIIGEAKSAGADIVKVSTMAESESDVKRLASLLLRADSDTELIVIAMGAIGAVSRVFFPSLGSRLTYAFIGGESAPGQLEFSETIDLLRKFYPHFDQRKTDEREIFQSV